jgi:hypothetical protein
MTTYLALITYSKDAHIWRLRLDPTPKYPNGKLLELPGFSGSIDDIDDAMRVDGTLGVWGVTRRGHLWRNEDGGFVVPVVELP